MPDYSELAVILLVAVLHWLNDRRSGKRTESLKRYLQDSLPPRAAQRCAMCEHDLAGHDDHGCSHRLCSCTWYDHDAVVFEVEPR